MNNIFKLPHLSTYDQFKYWIFRRLCCSNKKWTSSLFNRSDPDAQVRQVKLYDQIDFIDKFLCNSTSLENILLSINNIETLAKNIEGSPGYGFKGIEHDDSSDSGMDLYGSRDGKNTSGAPKHHGN